MLSPVKAIHSVLFLASAAFIALAMAPRAAAAQPATSSEEVAAMKAELEALRRVLPDQAHAMTDVDYHFANLWFAARFANWPLAEFYLNETRSHLNWAVRLRPVRRLASGQELDLRPVLQAIESSSLNDIKSAVGAHDAKGFEAAYRQTLA